AAGARARAPLRSRPRQDRNVSDTGAHPRYSGLPDHPSYRHTLKGITVQLYLPRDRSITHIGTIFHKKLPDGSMPKDKQMTFAPNTGYAFAVGSDTWHSADRI